MTVQKQPDPLIKEVKIDGNGKDGEQKTSTSVIEDIMERRRKQSTDRLETAEVERLALEAENEVAKLRGEPPKHVITGGGTITEEDFRKKQEAEAIATRDKLAAQARALIDAGIDPLQVGRFLMGMTPAPGGFVVPQGDNGKGFSMTDVKSLFEMMEEKKSSSRLEQAIIALSREITDIKRGGGKPKNDDQQEDPIDALIRRRDQMIELGMVARPGEATERAKKTLEETREDNRHNEHMAKLKADGEYKDKMVTAVTRIPKEIGAGLAEQMREGSSLIGEKPESVAKKLEYMVCEDCKTRIFITPETGKTVKCPKCGSEYEREVKQDVK